MFRVLHIMAGADAGGISTVVLNYYNRIDRDKIHFDIAVTTDMVGQNGKMLLEMGSQIYTLPLKSKGIANFEKSLEKLLIDKNYDAIHVHENETSYIALRVAKKVGIKCRIAHAHTTAPYMSIKGEIKRLSGCFLNYYYATTVIGCGQLAGERVFGKNNMHRKKACVLPNAIDTKKFGYNEEIRTQIRQSLQLGDRYVVGMVGRLSAQKNHLFALDFFENAVKEIPNAVLLIVGNGPDEEIIRKKIEERNMLSYVRLLGRRDDIDSLYQAFDVLIMPSLYEGFPVVAVEAMASGLPVILSDKITGELNFSNGVQYIPLVSEYWIDALKKTRNITGREQRQYEVKQNGLDIKETSQMLEKIYVGC